MNTFLTIIGWVLLAEIIGTLLAVGIIWGLKRWTNFEVNFSKFFKTWEDAKWL